METFTKLFSSLIVFVYHRFDRIVIHGYLSGLSRPEQVVYFVREVLGIPVVIKDVLSQRTGDYQSWVEAFARNHKIPIEWAGKGVRNEDYGLPALRRMEKRKAFGVYFIFKRMEQGRTSGSACRNIPRRIPTTVSWRSRRPASPVTISTFATRCWDRSSSAWHRSSPFMRRTG
jgi:hypothetical protein